MALDGILQKYTNKTSFALGLYNVFNDTLQYYQGTPMDDLWYIKNAVIGAKAFIEIPALIKSKTKGKYPIWLASKVAASLLPIVGPAIDLYVSEALFDKKQEYRHVPNFR